MIDFYLFVFYYFNWASIIFRKWLHKKIVGIFWERKFYNLIQPILLEHAFLEILLNEYFIRRVEVGYTGDTWHGNRAPCLGLMFHPPQFETTVLPCSVCPLVIGDLILRTPYSTPVFLKARNPQTNLTLYRHYSNMPTLKMIPIPYHLRLQGLWCYMAWDHHTHYLWPQYIHKNDFLDLTYCSILES